MHRKPIFKPVSKMEIIMRTSKSIWNNKSLILSFLVAIFVLFVATGCGKPLFVATKGAKYYHKPDCVFAAKSLEKHGEQKRVNYHFNWTTKLSKRVPCKKCNPEM
jgi:hypothetical protein